MTNGFEKMSVGVAGAERDIAILRRAGANPGLFWLGGFRSDMEGSKAQALDALGRKGASRSRALTIRAMAGRAASF